MLLRTEDSAPLQPWNDRLPLIAASRQLLVYYRGLFADLDRLDQRMPGAREIEVVSNVRLYFEAPHRPR